MAAPDLIARPVPLGPYLQLRIIDPTEPRPVHLVAVKGSSEPWTAKVIPRDTTAASTLALSERGRSWGRLRSERFPRVLELVDVDHVTLLVMQHVRSVSVRDLQASDGRDPLPVPVALHVVREVARSLEYLHSFDGVPLEHGNVSARSTLISLDGSVVVAGYRPLDHDREEDGRGGIARDLRALAKLCWSLATGHQPDLAALEGTTHAASLRTDLPPAVADVIARLMRDGFVSAKELAVELDILVSPADGAAALRAHLEPQFAARLAAERERDARLVQNAVAQFGAAPARSAQPDPQDALQVGMKLDRYKLIRIIGDGAMGVVYEGMHEELGRKVAIKVLRSVHRSKNIEARFRQEARATQNLSSPHIVQVTDVGATATGLPYFVMEYLDGVTVGELLKRSGGRIPVTRALEIGVQICDALAAAHEAGVIHRDLKPANVMIVNRGGDPYFAKVLDFGLAKVLGSDVKLTQGARFFGTVAYASPEQAAGASVTFAADLYAVGELLYEMISGTLPHAAETEAELLARKMAAPPVPLEQVRPDVPAAVAATIMQSLAIDPSDRHRSARSLGAELAQRLRELSAKAPPRRRRYLAPIIGGGVAIVLGAGLIYARKQPSARTAQVRVEARHPVTPVPPAAPTAPAAIPPPQPEQTVEPPAVRPAPPTPAVESAPRNARQESGHITRGHSAKDAAAGREAAELLRRAEDAFETGRPVDAVALAQQAVRKGAGAQGHVALGKYYLRMHLAADAAREYREAMRLDPQNRAAALGLKAAGETAGPR